MRVSKMESGSVLGGEGESWVISMLRELRPNFAFWRMRARALFWAEDGLSVDFISG